MPRTPKPVSTIDRFAQEINDELDSRGKALADDLGPPPGSAHYTQREVDDLWDTKDESVDQQALYDALQKGITPEGAQAVHLFQMSPDLAQFVVGKPLDPGTAAAVAKLAEYPGRYVLTTGHSSDAEDQVKFVDDMHKRAAKRQLTQSMVGAIRSLTPASQDVQDTVPMEMSV